MVELSGPILAFETSTGTASVAVVEPTGEVIAELTFRARRTMAERLVPQLQGLFEAVDLSPADLGAVAVGLGPGSFTSLRVGLATAQGILLGTQLPAIGVGSLEALAAATPLTIRQPICALIAAPKRHVYAGLYARMSESAMNVLMPPELLPLEQLSERLRQVGQPVAVNGLLKPAEQQLLATVGATFLAPVHATPRAAVVAMLGLRRLAAGESHEPARLTPLYIRPSEPEERLGQTFARPVGPDGP